MGPLALCSVNTRHRCLHTGQLRLSTIITQCIWNGELPEIDCHREFIVDHLTSPVVQGREDEGNSCHTYWERHPIIPASSRTTVAGHSRTIVGMTVGMNLSE